MRILGRGRSIELLFAEAIEVRFTLQFDRSLVNRYVTDFVSPSFSGFM
jgi:hypothetical protein